MRRSLNAILLAGAALALAAPASADSYFFRSKPMVDPPRPFAFAAAGNAEPGKPTESPVAQVRGHRGQTASISGGEYQICAAADCSDQTSWRTGQTAGLPAGFHARVRLTAAPYGEAARATLSVGDASATFEATSRAKDTVPAAFSFGRIDGVDPAKAARSAVATLSGFDGAPLSVTGGGYQICSTDACSEMNQAGMQTSPLAEVLPGTRIRLVATPAAYGSEATATLTVGGVSASFTAKARAKDTEPDAIQDFPSLTGVQAASDQVSAVRQLVGFDEATVSASGTGAAFRTCTTATCADQGTGGWQTAAATVAPGTYVQLRLTAIPGGETRTATLAYGSRTTSWSATALPAGPYSISEMGIADTGLMNALSNALGSQKDWVQCRGPGATESCVGARSVLYVHTKTGTGYEFGAYVNADIFAAGEGCGSYSTIGTGGWILYPGFMFTTVPQRAAYLMDGSGKATSSGQVNACGANQFIPLYWMAETYPLGINPNGAQQSWNTGYTLTGLNNQTTPSTLKVYKRK